MIIINKLNTCRRQEIFHAFEIFMRGTRASIEQQDFYCRIIAYRLGPDVESPFRRLNRNHFNASGLNAGILEAKIAGTGSRKFAGATCAAASRASNQDKDTVT